MNWGIRVKTVHFTGDEERWLHVAYRPPVNELPVTPPILKDCGILHTTEFHFTDCPVASRWTLLRSA